MIDSPDALVQEHAITAILNLSINDVNKTALTVAGAIPALVEVGLRLRKREIFAAKSYGLQDVLVALMTMLNPFRRFVETPRGEHWDVLEGTLEGVG